MYKNRISQHQNVEISLKISPKPLKNSENRLELSKKFCTWNLWKIVGHNRSPLRKLWTLDSFEAQGGLLIRRGGLSRKFHIYIFFSFCSHFDPLGAHRIASTRNQVLSYTHFRLLAHNPTSRQPSEWRALGNQKPIEKILSTSLIHFGSLGVYRNFDHSTKIDMLKK